MPFVVSVIGVAFVVLSSVPVPVWMWAGFFLSLVPLLKCLLHRQCSQPLQLWNVLAPFLVMGLLLIGIELGVSWRHDPPPNMTRRIVVLGDSLSAAETDPGLRSWPAVLEAAGWDVDNRARMGATASSALRQLKSWPVTGQTVLVVIGGNDLLGSTTRPQFEQSLEALIAEASRDSARVVLFELPLPPFCGDWGRPAIAVIWSIGGSWGMCWERQAPPSTASIFPRSATIGWPP